MHQQICSIKEARSLKIRPKGSLQITSNTILWVQDLPGRIPPKTRYKYVTRRVTSVTQDELRVCNNTWYERAIDASRACNTTRYMRTIDTLLCATTHYGVCESDSLHDTGELPDTLHDTGKFQQDLSITTNTLSVRQALPVGFPTSVYQVSHYSYLTDKSKDCQYKRLRLNRLKYLMCSLYYSTIDSQI